jgi:hypothetical protein
VTTPHDQPYTKPARAFKKDAQCDAFIDNANHLPQISVEDQKFQTRIIKAIAFLCQVARDGDPDVIRWLEYAAYDLHDIAERFQKNGGVQ